MKKLLSKILLMITLLLTSIEQNAQTGCDQGGVQFFCYYSVGSTVVVRNEFGFIIYQNLINSNTNFDWQGTPYYGFELSLADGCYTIECNNDPDGFYIINLYGVDGGVDQLSPSTGTPVAFSSGGHYGCSDPSAINYNPLACDDQTCCDFPECVYDPTYTNMVLELCQLDNGFGENTYYNILQNCSGNYYGTDFGGNVGDGQHHVHQFVLPPGEYTLEWYEPNDPVSFTYTLTANGATVASGSGFDSETFTVGGGDTYGCTDEGACNYDPIVSCDNGSCQYDLDCCPGTANYFSVLFEDNDDTDEQFCFDFYDANGNWLTGNCIYEDDGSTESYFCLVEGCYELEIYDPYGTTAWTFYDGGGNAQATGTGGGIFDPVCNNGGGDDLGCTNNTACNFDPLADIDDGTCMFGEHTFHLSLMDDGNDGWEGSEYQFTNSNGDIVISGTLETGGANWIDRYFCLDDGCYNLAITNGNDNAEVHWTLWDVNNNIGSGIGSGAPSTTFNFILGTNSPPNSFVIEMWENGPAQFDNAGWSIEHNGNFSGGNGFGGGNYGIWAFCGPASGCYSIDFNGGTTAQDVTWRVTGTSQGIINGSGLEDAYFTFGGGAMGCTDVAASNYNSNATCDDGSCDYSTPGDFNNDGAVNVTDLLLFTSGFGCTSNCGPADLNGDGVVNTTDLLLFTSNFG